MRGMLAQLWGRFWGVQSGSALTCALQGCPGLQIVLVPGSSLKAGPTPTGCSPRNTTKLCEKRECKKCQRQPPPLGSPLLNQVGTPAGTLPTSCCLWHSRGALLPAQPMVLVLFFHGLLSSCSSEWKVLYFFELQPWKNSQSLITAKGPCAGAAHCKPAGEKSFHNRNLSRVPSWH